MQAGDYNGGIAVIIFIITNILYTISKVGQNYVGNL
jgi:hypothetical protein